MGTKLLPQKGGGDVYCGQTAGWIKTALGKEVGLGPGHTVLDRDPDPLPFSADFHCGQRAVCIRI